MSVEDVNKIDAISIDPNGNIVLSISDHLEWDNNNQHLLILQKKINCYLGAIETGEINEVYPDAKGKKVTIAIFATCFLNHMGELFLERVKQTLENAGYGYRFEILIDKSAF